MPLRTHPKATIGVYLLFVPLVIVAIVAWTSAQQAKDSAKQGREAHVALCAFKNDLVQRVHGAATFLREHPDGFAGIPASTIRNSLRNQRATVDSLRSLDCEAP